MKVKRWQNRLENYIPGKFYNYLSASYNYMNKYTNIFLNTHIYMDNKYNINDENNERIYVLNV